jgi:hypothetical protein
MYWKQYIIYKFQQERKGMIEVIYTSLEKNVNLSSRQDRLFVNIDSKCYPYRCYDLWYYKGLKRVVEVYSVFNISIMMPMINCQLFL